MNKRIRELVKQATLPGYMLGESYVQSRLDEQKFAELIVRECADKCLAMAYVNPGPHHYAAMIKEHFGVEE